MSDALAQWQIGHATITAVVEQDLVMDGLISKAKPEALAQIPWLHPHFVDADGRMLALVQCFVIEIDGKIIVVDTCVGDEKDLPSDPAWHRQHFGLLRKFADAGFDPAAVDMVLCTHLHLDHVGINTQLIDGEWVPTFPNARYLFARTEYEHWEAEAKKDPVDPSTLERPFDRYQAGFQATQKRVHEQSVEPVMQAGLAELVDPPCEPIPGIQLVPTTGHTPGHVSVAVHSQGEAALITGDAFHHPCQIARADWATVADYDRAESSATRARMLEELGASGALMLGTHFARPTGGRVVRDGDSWKMEV
ncbi:MBL fold metallo-hydrolase [Erythrobacter sp. Alg231-14]|uniref:MBL fold metallo-hydrolase n=1 Tax=Erythrobacter sp. Alg231-14 TaxID=1922225 RepID=UPI000D55381B